MGPDNDPPGKAFDEVIEVELTAARCAIVLWSKAAIASRWVREEAQDAVDRNILFSCFCFSSFWS